MSANKVLILVSIILFINSDSIIAQKANYKDGHEKIMKARKEFISEGLELSQEQSDRFWPVYDAHLDEVHAIMKENRRRRIPKMDLTEEEAQEILQQIMQRKRKELELQLSLYEKLREFMTAKQILHLDYRERRFHQKVVERIRGKGRKRGH